MDSEAAAAFLNGDNACSTGEWDGRSHLGTVTDSLFMLTKPFRS
jgi:hypothetical protein